MQEFLIKLSTEHLYLVYLFIVIFACIEGPVLSMLFGVLIKLGYFSFTPIYIALILGDLFGDTVLYFIGYFAGHRFIRRFGKRFHVSEDGVAKVTKIFHKYRVRILIISKITNGFGLSIVTLLTAGITKIPFWKYLGANLVGQFIWTGFLIGIGYFFSDFYLQIDNALGRASIITAFIILIGGFIKYRKFLTKKAGNFEI